MAITDTEALTRCIEHREIFHDEMLALVRRIMSGEMSPVTMAALLIGLRFVTHLDVDRAGIERAIAAVRGFFEER